METTKFNPKLKDLSRVAQDEALSRVRHLLNKADYEQLIMELEKPLRPAIRANPLKLELAADAVRGWAIKYGWWEVEPVPYCDTGWWISTGESDVSLGKTIEHKLGLYYIQDAASMLPVELFDFNKMDSPMVLDMAASPGGKTTHLVSRTADRGLVIANDSSAGRITALRLVLGTWGAVNAAVTRFAGENFGDWYPDTFDAVLLDAPCSMENLRSTESHPMRPISERERESLAKRQLRLLESAFKVVKLGGQVVYATCTLAPEEDEAVVSELIERHPESLRIEDVSHHLPVPALGLTSTGQHEYHPIMSRALRLYPHLCGTSGFFSTLIRKTATLGQPTLMPPQRSLRSVGFRPFSKREEKELVAVLLDRYGFKLESLLEDQGLALWRRNKSVYAFPEAFMSRFADLPCQSLGLEIGEWTPHFFVVSHEWATRFHARFHQGCCTLADESVPKWMRGEDVPLQGCRDPVGSMVVVMDESGQPLGRGKVLPQRLKNMLPRRIVVD